MLKKWTIKRIIKSIIYRLGRYASIDVYFEQNFVPPYTKIIEEQLGHKQSRLSKEAVDKDNNPLPWFTYPAIEYIKQLDLKAKTVLEWGSGNSSLFFANCCEKVCSIEGNKEWFDKVSENKKTNHQIVFVEKKEYVEAISKFDTKFDIIVIDGILREECAKVAINYLKEDGFIILDNSERHPDIAQELRSKGLIEVDMFGLGPINSYTWATSLFFSKNVFIKPLTEQPLIPIGGIQ